MDDIWSRVLVNLGDRVHGLMNFKFALQPIIASILGIISGLNDARARRPPYLSTLLVNPVHRGDMVRDGWKSMGKVFIVALILDVVYQTIVMQFVYTGEALIVGFVLTIAPYIMLRGVFNIIARIK